MHTLKYMKPLKSFSKIRAFCADNTNQIKTVLGLIALYVIVGCFFLTFIPWKGWVHVHCTSCISKSEMSLLLLKVFNIFNVGLIAMVGIATALNRLISLASSKFFGYFNIGNPIEENISVRSSVITCVLILLTSHFCYAVFIAILHHK